MKPYDLIVVGGGLSGVAAAVSAAREGLHVLLAEKDGSLGGAMSNSFVYPFMGYKEQTASGEWVPLSVGIFAEMTQRHDRMGGNGQKGWQPEIFKIVLDEMVTEAGVDVLFHTHLVDVIREDRILKSVLLAGKNGLMEIHSSFFIDATGDGDLMAFAGCEFQLGRESDTLCQPMTTCFRVSGVDIPQFHVEKESLQALYKQKQAAGEITNPRENILVFEGIGDGIIHFNTTRVVKHNPIDPIELSKAEIEARRQVLEMYNFLCENSKAFANSVLISIAQQIGVRESRKLKGVHILTEEDIMSFIIFEDSIALGNNWIDIHNPEGTGTYIVPFEASKYYSIPYRSLLPKEIDNLLVAGRCLSATHVAHSAVRILPICTCLGEAAGTAAAVAIHTERNAHTVDVKAVQHKLVENGARIR